MAEPIDTTFYSGELTPEEQVRFNDLFTDIAELQFEVGLDGMNGDDGFYDIFANSDKIGSQFNVTVDTEDRKLKMEELQEPITDTYQNGDVVEFTDVVLDDDTQTVQEATVEFVGVKNTKSRSKSATTESTTFNIDPNGNQQPENAVMRLTGERNKVSDSNSSTISDGGSDSFNIEGNSPPEQEEVTLSATYSENSITEEGYNVNYFDVSVEAGGSLPPKNGTVSVSSFAHKNSYSELENGPLNGMYIGSSTGDSASKTIDLSGLDAVSEVQLDLWSTADPYGDGGIACYIDGVLLEDDSNPTYYGYKENSPNTWRGGPIELSDPSNVTIKFELTNSGGNWTIAHKTNDPGSLEILGAEPSEVQISKPDGTSEYLYSEGDSLSFDATKIWNNQTDITIDTDFGECDYEISWKERDGVKDPSVSIDSSSISYSGILDGSYSENINLSSGSNSVSATYTGGTGLSYTVNWKEVNETENPTANFDSGTTTLSHSGKLDVGNTIEKSINLTTGTHTVDVSSTGPVQAEVVWDDVSITEDPEIVLNGNSVSYTGSIADGNSQTVTVDPSYLVSGTNSVTVNTVSATLNSDVQVKLTYGDNSAFLHSTYNSLGFTPSSATLSGLYEADQDVTVTFYIEDDAGNSVKIPSFDSETSLSALSSGNVRLVAEIDRTAFSQSFTFDNYSVFFTQ